MAIYRLDSPEFAECWRSVSESILAALQKNSLADTQQHPYTPIPAPDGINNGTSTMPPKQEPPVDRGQADILYATRPTPKGDGAYNFKNLRTEREKEHTYKIWRYQDGTCEFELLTDLDSEGRQNFKDNQAERMPDAVGITSGNISSDGEIIIVNRGKGVKNGNSVRITEPVNVKFN